MKSIAIAVMSLIFSAGLLAQTTGAKTLDIYFIDVEGGQATLIVTPQRETLLIDTGFAGSALAASTPGATSHASRIAAAARDAGVKQIDYLLITHFHSDHVGGVAELAQLLPIGTFIDHGSLAERERNAPAMSLFNAYAALRDKGRHIEPSPGDRLPLKAVEVTVVSSAAQTLAKPLGSSSGSNTACDMSARPAADAGENARSTGVVVRWGKFRFLDIGDLTTRPLFDLVCPNDLIGAVDVYLVAHHGGADAAKPETFASFKPRVAIVNNGAKKGGSREIFDYLQRDRSLEGVWQLHRAEASGATNFAEERIANLDESTAHYIKLSANEDGSFRVLNGRTGQWTEYRSR
jgi:beta-lactamase superfamily II metal-dependent hydrolase